MKSTALKCGVEERSVEECGVEECGVEECGVEECGERGVESAALNRGIAALKSAALNR